MPASNPHTGNLRILMALFFFTLLVIAVCAEGPANGVWKSYIKGPGVTYVTCKVPLLRMVVICPGLELSTPTNSLVIPYSFTYETDSGFGIIDEIAWTVNCIGPSGTTSVGGTDTSPNKVTPELYSCPVTLDVSTQPLNTFVDYTLHLSVNYEVNGQITIIEQDCPVKVKRTNLSGCTNVLAMQVIEAQKTIRKLNLGGGSFDDYYGLVEEGQAIPLFITDRGQVSFADDKFKFWLLMPLPGIPTTTNTISWDLFKVGNDNSIRSGSFPFVSDTQLNGRYCGDQIDGNPGVVSLEGLSNSLIPGDYRIRFHCQIGSDCFEKNWSFRVVDPYLRFADTYETHCFHDSDSNSLQGVTLDFERHDLVTWDRVFTADDSYFTNERLLDGSDQLIIFSDQVYFMMSPYMVGSAYYRMEGERQYPNDSKVTVRSSNSMRVRYYPIPDNFTVSAPQCAVAGVPYTVRVGMWNWNPFTQITLEESLDSSFNTILSSYPVSGDRRVLTKTLSTDTVFYYRATCTNGCGTTFTTDPTAVTVHAQDTIPPNPPSIQTITVLDYQSIRLSVFGTDCGQIKYYKIYGSTAPGVGAEETKRIVTSVPDSTGGITFEHTGLTNGVTYYYVATAVDAAGNESAPSAERSATTYPDATPPSAPSEVKLRYYSTGVELLQNASRQILFLSFQPAREPDSAIAYYQAGLKDLTLGTPVDWRWNLDVQSPLRYMLNNANLVMEHNYQIQVRAVNTSFAIGETASTASFTYMAGTTYAREESDFTNDSFRTNSIWEVTPSASALLWSGATTHTYQLSSGAGEATLIKKIFPAPKFAMETIVKTLGPIDGTGYFEIRLEGIEGAYVVRMYYGYGNNAHYVAKYVGGTAVATKSFSTSITQNQTILLTIQHDIVLLENGTYISRFILGGFGQDVVLEDTTATSLDVYQLKYLAHHQILGVDYYSYTGEAVQVLPHDPTPPSQPVVTPQEEYLGLGGAASAFVYLQTNWITSDPQSNVTQYQYAVGKTPGSSNVVPWTTVNPPSPETNHTETIGFTAQDGTTYYVSVKAKNDKNMWSTVGTSPGVLADRYANRGFFDPFEVSPLDNTADPYAHSSFGITYQSASCQVHLENVNTATPAYLGNDYTRSLGDTGFTEGSFRIGLNFHDAPGGSPDAHMFEFYLGQFLTDPTNPGNTHYKIRLLQNILTIEKYYQGTREVYKTYTVTITKNSWSTLQFTFKGSKINIQGLGINQTFTVTPNRGIPVHNFLLRFQRVNLEIDNVSLTDQTFGII